MGRTRDQLEALLAEQLAYYRAPAPEYFQTSMLDVDEAKLSRAQRELLAAPEMLKLAAENAGGERIRFIQADGEDSAIILRRLTDGAPHRVVKVPHRPAELERRVGRLGWGFR